MIDPAKRCASVVKSRKVHKAFFRYALCAHLLHVGISGLAVNSFEAAISFAAGVGTILIHVSEETEEETETKLRDLIRAEQGKGK